MVVNKSWMDREIARITAVLNVPCPNYPLIAYRKLKIKPVPGGVKTLVDEYSAPVLNAINMRGIIGTITKYTLPPGKYSVIPCIICFHGS